MEIYLVPLTKYAEEQGVHRTTVWRWTKENTVDYYALVESGKKERKKWFHSEELNPKRKVLNIGLPI
ncbi:MAG: hypothetical protein A2172_03935 [Candidatus Woykebacteria bacterium RBG_13_40_15]|uniref:Helix-turn-helix domain-containing protein n=1 Tax=Candidatus Woykebacteria bacterium RBG_13_40_15 TaxID=1802593 RepID=A0A1G1WA50_9BACT|nr:MAG: hypothetical protein A2172_03935 [Candidatus Woykebacteria bacterium RBG_13_40_15]